MKKTNVRQLSLWAILTALSVVLAYIHIPTPTGFLTLLDAGIYFTAFYLGAKAGAVVGGLSGFLIDMLLGYPQYMIHSLIAHGSQGFFGGWRGKKRVLGLILASLFMVGWYFLAAILLGYGVGAAWAGIFGNILQNFFGMGLGYLLYKAIVKLNL
ncbi:ECF transporter S component [Streptococcus thoraltensis]|uniref:ECF transporter S component n=1 Tax=Streptococcus thoraltensis TaxID=55085 RepID=UPI000377B4CA|nr:ECF transporter S component [Streptococcus thoraltensis]MDY4760862.1 ECF transporter S component [Streptococcus thoraltensis]